MTTLTLEPEVEATVQGIRQLCEAELVACQLRQMAADLIKRADALEIAYGVIHSDPKRIVKMAFSARKTPRSKKPKK